LDNHFNWGLVMPFCKNSNIAPAKFWLWILPFLLCFPSFGNLALAQSTWVEVTSATAGEGREGHSMAYDGYRKVVIMFGGRNPSAYYDSETYQWDGIEWTLVSASGPHPRFGHAMAYDEARKEIVMFGGADPSENYYFKDTWVWNGTRWHKVANIGPDGRYLHAMVYDSNRKVVVLYGGMAWDTEVFGDVWEWNGRNWTMIGDFDSPVPRYGHAMAYDSDRQVVVMQGGRHENQELSPSTWEWDGSHWTLRSTGGPAGRCRHAMAYDSNRKVTVLFGGWEDGGNLNDTWEWNGSAWTEITPTLADSIPSISAPSKRRGHAMAYDAANRMIVLFGGSRTYSSFYNFFDACDDTWLYGTPKTYDLSFKLVYPAPNIVSPGSQIRLIARVLNSGNDASDACSVDFYLSPDKVIDATDLLMGSASLPAIRYNRSLRVKKVAIVPLDLGKGIYYVIAKVLIADGNSDNNIKASKITLSVR
jgi:hypothetical protein